MREINILWADDEIDLLKPHIIFLEQKGYTVLPVNNGREAIERVNNQKFDIIFLDEQMPGITGLDTLLKIKEIRPEIPVVMITKSEEENIMEAAIGSKISDYLIKPVNPNQIILSIKKNLEKNELVTQKTSSVYRSEFNNLGELINQATSYQDWIDVYKKLVYWELELGSITDEAMKEIVKMQKNEANSEFCKFIRKNYEQWFQEKNNNSKPEFITNVVKNTVLPLLNQNKKVLLLVIDNLRWDQWMAVKPTIQNHFSVKQEDAIFSILPTTTQYARNALFAGLMPYAIESLFPDLWKYDEDEGLKNKYEKDMLAIQLKRLGFTDSFIFEKVVAVSYAKGLPDKVQSIRNSKLSVIVYNYVDTLSHASTDSDLIKELAADEAAYRSLTVSWFNHSPIFEVLKAIADQDITVVLTTDHGSIQVQNPVKVIGDKTITTNLRYKHGKKLDYNSKQVYEIKSPKNVQLPASHLSSTYIFAQNNDYFVYPNNYNEFVKYYKDTFQHGGISLEEMIIPKIVLGKK
ncbi:MAG: PglZ domain-containing protein [Bacteroidales bacterium]